MQTQTRRIVQYLVPITLLALSILLFYTWTLGFNAFTTYSYTLQTAGKLPRPTPNFKLINKAGQHINSTELFKGKYTLLTFVYFHCPSVCPMIDAKLVQVHAQLKPLMPKKFVMASISFDKNRDTPYVLRHVWLGFDKPIGWYPVTLATEFNPALHEKLRRYGIWVHRRADGYFNHSSYLFLLNPNGQLIHVFQPELSSNQIVQTVRKLMS